MEKPKLQVFNFFDRKIIVRNLEIIEGSIQEEPVYFSGLIGNLKLSPRWRFFLNRSQRKGLDRPIVSQSLSGISPSPSSQPQTTQLTKQLTTPTDSAAAGVTSGANIAAMTSSASGSVNNIYTLLNIQQN